MQAVAASAGPVAIVAAADAANSADASAAGAAMPFAMHLQAANGNDAAATPASAPGKLKLLAMLKQGTAPVVLVPPSAKDADAKPSADDDTPAIDPQVYLAQFPPQLRAEIIAKLKERGIDLDALKNGQAARPGASIQPVEDRRAGMAQAAPQPTGTAQESKAGDAAPSIADLQKIAAEIAAEKNAAAKSDAVPAPVKDALTPDTQPAVSQQADLVAKLAQQSQRSSAPEQVTVAQNVPARFGGENAGQNAGQNSGDDANSNTDRSTRSAPHKAADPVIALPERPLAAQAAATAAAQPAPATVPATAETAAAQAAANTAPQPARTTVAAALHVQQQTQAHAPDIGALAVTIAAKSGDGEKHFDIRLDPPELGRIDVRLSLDDSGKASAHLSADSQGTLDLLQRDQRHLERALKDAGLELSNNGLNFSLKGQERQDGNGARSLPRGRALSVSAVAANEAAVTQISPSSIARGDARLDIRV